MPNKLEQIGMDARANQIAPNTYRQDWANQNQSDNYSPTHTRALADIKTPEHGKGTGNYLDTGNYLAGSMVDIFGDPSILGSGRSAELGVNGYGPVNNYIAPDTSKNLGQVQL